MIEIGPNLHFTLNVFFVRATVALIAWTGTWRNK